MCRNSSSRSMNSPQQKRKTLQKSPWVKHDNNASSGWNTIHGSSGSLEEYAQYFKSSSTSSKEGATNDTLCGPSSTQGGLPISVSTLRQTFPVHHATYGSSPSDHSAAVQFSYAHPLIQPCNSLTNTLTSWDADTHVPEFPCYPPLDPMILNPGSLDWNGSQWSQWSLSPPVMCRLAQFVQRGSLLLGLSNGLVVYFTDFAHALCHHNTPSHPFILNMVPPEMHGRTPLSWVNLSLHKDAFLCVSELGLYYQSLRWGFFVRVDTLPYVESDMSSSVQFLGLPDPMDIVTASMRSYVEGVSDHIFVGTQKGFVHFVDPTASTYLNTMSPLMYTPTLTLNGVLSSSYLSIPDSFTCSSLPLSSRAQNEWPSLYECGGALGTQHSTSNTATLGTIGGNVVLCDSRCPRIISRVNVASGPILSLATSEFRTVVLGVSHQLTLDEQMFLCNNDHALSLQQYLRVLSIWHHWATDMGVIDIRMLRSMLHLKRSTWDRKFFSSVPDPAHRGPASLKTSFSECIALDIEPRQSQCLYQLRKDGGVLSCDLNQLHSTAHYTVRSEPASWTCDAAIIDLNTCYEPTTHSTVLAIIDSAGRFFYRKLHNECRAQHDNVCGKSAVLLPYSLKNGSPTPKGSCFPAPGSTPHNAFSSHGAPASLNALSQSHVRESSVRTQEPSTPTCALPVDRSTTYVYSSTIPLGCCYLPWNPAVFVLHQYSLGNPGYFGRWLSPVDKQIMETYPFFEAFCKRDLDRHQTLDKDRVVNAYSALLKGNADTYSKRNETDPCVMYLTASHRRRLLYNTDGALALFNLAGPSGLDPCARCPILNVFVQILRFTPFIEPYLHQHYCEKDTCLLCEIAFLCHMLNEATKEGQGKPCQAKNLVTVLEQIPEARLLRIVLDVKDAVFNDPMMRFAPGPLCQQELPLLLHDTLPRIPPGDKENFVDHQDLTFLVRTFIPFLMQQLRRGLLRDQTESCTAGGSEKDEPYDFITRFFTWNIHTLSSCVKSNHDAASNVSTRFLIKLENESNNPSRNGTPQAEHDYPDLETILNRSLRRRFSHVAFCDVCQTRTLHHYEEKIDSVPPILILDSADLDWTQCSTPTLPQDFWIDHGQNGVNISVIRDDTRASTKWNHYSLFAVVCRVKEGSSHICSEPTVSTSDMATPDYSAPLFDPVSSGAVDTQRVREPLETALENDRRSALVPPIADHLVAYIHVPTNDIKSRQSILGSQQQFSSLHMNSSNGVDKASDHFKLKSVDSSGNTQPCDAYRDPLTWVLFNDLCVTCTHVEQVVTTFTEWSSIVCFFYALKNGTSENPFILSSSATTARPFTLYKRMPAHCLRSTVNLSQHPLAATTPHFIPLTPREIESIISSGSVLAIDTEFVLLNKPCDLRDDAYALARVSIIRAEGPLTGIPCLDCHVVAKEEPLDYLTKFSGLKPGDLDITHSSYWLTSRKSVYQILRFFIDNNCSFIGHGLSKDFRIVNVFVPEHQTLDTAQLFRFPGCRLLSLRFLSKHLLGRDVQTSSQGHDSVDDAAVALDLYRHYEALEPQGILPKVLDYLYSR